MVWPNKQKRTKNPKRKCPQMPALLGATPSPHKKRELKGSVRLDLSILKGLEI